MSKTHFENTCSPKGKSAKSSTKKARTQQIVTLISFLPLSHLFHLDAWWNLRKSTVLIAREDLPQHASQILEREEGVSDVIAQGNSVVTEIGGAIGTTNYIDRIHACESYSYRTPVACRQIPLGTQWVKASRTIHGNPSSRHKFTYDWFALPGFPVLVKHLPKSVWSAASNVQKELEGTYISRSTIILAAMIYKWVLLDDFLRGENCRESKRTRTTKLVEDPGFLRFAAYFPSWFLFHETNRIGAYGHPFDFVNAKYAEDMASDMRQDLFSLPEPKAEENKTFLGKFDVLNDKVEAGPVVFMSPAMMEGSAMAGPYLPINNHTLSDVHACLGWGSVWNLGLPQMTTLHNGQRCIGAVGAFSLSKSWLTELLPEADPDVMESQDHHDQIQKLSFEQVIQLPLFQERLTALIGDRCELKEIFLGSDDEHPVLIIPVGLRSDIELIALAEDPGRTSYIPGKLSNQPLTSPMVVKFSQT